MNGQLKINQMFAFVAMDKDGTEGIIGANSPMGWMPLVGADIDRINSLRPMVLEIVQQTKIPVMLIKLSLREDLEIIDAETK